MTDSNQETKQKFAFECYSVSLHNAITQQQAVYLEACYGKGAHSAIALLEQFMEGPGNIPDDPEAPFKDPLAYYQKHQAHYGDSVKVDLTCFCGLPATMVAYNNKKGNFGYCSSEHMRQHEHGYHLLPKPGKVVIPLTYLDALLLFIDDHQLPYNGNMQSYLAVQIDDENNFIFTATDRHIIAQYQPGPFNPEKIIENLLLEGKMLQFILESCDFNNLTLHRTHDNNWQFTHGDYLIQFKSAPHEVPSSLPKYIIEGMANPMSSSFANYQAKYLLKIKLAGELLSATPSISLHNGFTKPVDGIVPPLGIVKFDGAPFFKVALMPVKNEPPANQEKH